MKSVSLAEARSDIEALLDSAQKERVLITRAGKPTAVIVGVESYDEEDLALARAPEFWRMIEQRRRGRSISLAQLKARLKARAQKQHSNGKRKGSSKSSRSKGGRGSSPSAR